MLAQPTRRIVPDRIARLMAVLVCGAAVWIFCHHTGLTPRAAAVALTASLMIGLWVTEAVPMGAASLLPLAFLPLLGVMSPAETARLYAEPNVFLFLGGFLLAIAMEEHGLHRRIALAILARLGTGPRRMIGGFALSTGLLSMWISNTASTLLMLPIALAVIGRMDEILPEGRRQRFATALLLAISYAASIGGIATLVGSPPNMILAGQAKTLLPHLPELSFVTWLRVMLPVAGGLLFICWVYLAVLCGGRGEGVAPAGTLDRLGPWTSAERRVALIFALTVLGWVTREPIDLGWAVFPGWAKLIGAGRSHDAVVAVSAALLLFTVPARDGAALLDERAFRRVPWEVLLLFGGGFALAEAFQVSGLAERAVSGAAALKGMTPWALVLCVCLISTFASELMSNTAQVTLMVPLLAAASSTVGVHPYLLMVPATLAASLAFMMPVGTPPNAIVFASGRLRLADMVRAGFALNLIAAAWVTLCMFVFGLRGLGVSP
ncbi:MAG: Sodium-dependent dicarboxylate transporter SdcS [Candidatus Omnitrophica bacterium]|nr:Sodium-dependent dicarboxylate transporter SdcS [Candidatus Omnitrophota bacterium]